MPKTKKGGKRNYIKSRNKTRKRSVKPLSITKTISETVITPESETQTMNTYTNAENSITFIEESTSIDFENLKAERTYKNNKHKPYIKKQTPPTQSDIQSIQTPNMESSDYNPTINKELIIFNTKTKRKDEFTCPVTTDVKVKVSKKGQKKEYKCLPYTSQRAQKQLIKLLNQDIRSSNVVAPKQMDSNCWFNCMFMSFFISDKGRKFMRSLRYMMITGYNPMSKEQLSPTLHKNLFLLNRAIQESMDGNQGSREYIDNTNHIIKSIYKDYSSFNKSKLNKYWRELYDRGQDGNPIVYLMALFTMSNYNALNILLYEQGKKYIDSYYISQQTNKILRKKSEYKNANDWQMTVRPNFLMNKNKKQLPHIIVYNFHQGVPTPKTLTQRIKYKRDFVTGKTIAKTENIEYALDSAIVLDNKGNHFVCFVTVDGVEYYFDGETRSRLHKYDWKKRIHNIENNKVSKETEYLKFSVGYSYRYYIYYRVK